MIKDKIKTCSLIGFFLFGSIVAASEVAAMFQDDEEEQIKKASHSMIQKAMLDYHQEISREYDRIRINTPSCLSAPYESIKEYMNIEDIDSIKKIVVNIVKNSVKIALQEEKENYIQQKKELEEARVLLEQLNICKVSPESEEDNLLNLKEKHNELGDEGVKALANVATILSEEEKDEFKVSFTKQFESEVESLKRKFEGNKKHFIEKLEYLKDYYTFSYGNELYPCEEIERNFILEFLHSYINERINKEK